MQNYSINAVYSEPGESKVVELVEIAGNKVIHGGNNLVDGPVASVNLPSLMERILAQGFAHAEAPEAPPKTSTMQIKRKEYCDMFGPTTGILSANLLCGQY